MIAAMSQAKVTVSSIIVINNRVVTFVDIDDEYICCICMQVANDPVRCSGLCAGIFCNNCMDQALARTKTCPSCSKDNTTASRDVILRNQIMKHKVFCPNRGVDNTTSSSRKRSFAYLESLFAMCTWIGRYDQLGNHLNTCEWETVTCLNDGCLKKMERRELFDHDYACVHRKVKCDHCNVMVKAAAINNHVAQCDMVEVECDIVGCGAKMKKIDYEKHQDDSAKHHVRLLSAENQRLSKLSESQSALRAVKWKITNIADKLEEAARGMKDYDSPKFDMFLHGNHKLYIRAKIGDNKLELYLKRVSDHEGVLNVGGTSFTVTKAGLPRVKETLGDDRLLDASNGWGFSLLTDMSRYIDNDSISVTADLKLSRFDEPIVL